MKKVYLSVMILVIADNATTGERALALALALVFGLGGAFFWTLLGRVVHRFAARS